MYLGCRVGIVNWWIFHYNDVIMGSMASQITSPTIFYSTVYTDWDQRKHHSFESLAFVWGMHWGLVNSPHKWPIKWKMFPFDDIIMFEDKMPHYNWSVLYYITKLAQDGLCVASGILRLTNGLLPKVSVVVIKALAYWEVSLLCHGRVLGSNSS